MRMTVLAAVIAMAVPSFFTGSTAFAQPPCAGGCSAPARAPEPGGCQGRGGSGAGPGMGGGAIEALMPILGGLDLADDQRESIDAILEETREEIRAVSEESRIDPMARFIEVFSAEDITVADLEALADEMAARRDAAREIEMEAIVRIHEVLTPEQLESIASLPGPGEGSARCGGRGGRDRG